MGHNAFSSLTLNVTSTASPVCVYCKNSSDGSIQSWVCKAASLLSVTQILDKVQKETHKVKNRKWYHKDLSTFGWIYITSKFNCFPTYHCPRSRRCGHWFSCNDSNLLKWWLEIRQQPIEITWPHNKTTGKFSPIKRKMLDVRFNIAANPVGFLHACTTYQFFLCEII